MGARLLNPLLLLIAIAAPLAAMAQPRASFIETRHNFGAFLEDDGLAECSFAIINEGTSPLTILSARATCGCTTPTYSRRPIAPGDTAYISVAYDPSSRPGRFSKYIDITTNANPQNYRLEICGVVIGSEATIGRRYPIDMGPLKLARDIFPLGDATIDRLKTVYLEGYNRSTDSLRICVENVPPYMDVVVAPKIAAPGEQVTLIAYVTPSKKGDYGITQDTIAVTPADGLRFELPTLINVVEDFSGLDAAKMANAPIAVPSTEHIELGKVHHNRPIKATLSLTNAGKNPLAVRRVYSTDRGVSASIAQSNIKKGKSAEITVDIDPSEFNGGLLNTRLMIITNDPLHPVYTIRLVAEWAD